LESIWLHAIENLLKISKADLPKYRAVLIIPALYNRSLIKHYLVKQRMYVHIADASLDCKGICSEIDDVIVKCDVNMKWKHLLILSNLILTF
jgi:hypothetical protein